MNQLADIKRILVQMKPELAQRFQVQVIGLFGSVIRSGFSLSSDIDISVA